ncbi:hypothetical protein G7068_07735 [Leucobacter viscericola]|uniref:PucR family transcriptional regulator n=1 Tax=Leucobacter viscericola TaxID=2714935 RepID=A0A6G7XF14_9MICO|nr:PucR family transcriptional regulator ligand-binding domain-containing protein [Leucobacter viscericola]QIK63102.1 hypothetical protein G7068_07735 [Leucobacter viscericola]
MTFTVRSLLDLTEAQTTSLTPGVGEDHPITWAHVCELSEPWRWLGQGALLMTTGIGIPDTSEEQCAYLREVHAAGISAIAIDETPADAPFAEAALLYAAHIGLPVLQTAHEVPFIVLAKAVAATGRQERVNRLQQTERLYAVAGAHAVDDAIETLLEALESVLESRLQLRPGSAVGEFSPPQEPPGTISQLSARIYSTQLLAPGTPELRFASVGPVDHALMLHAAGVVSSALSVKAAARRNEWMHGSLLLTDLCDESVPSSPAEHLVAAYNVLSPYLFAVVQSDHARSALDEVHAVFAADRVPALATIKDGHVLILAEAGERIERLLELLATETTRIGVSAQFSQLSDTHAALRQARSALIRNRQSGRVLRFEENEATSLFLPSNMDQLRGIARQVLGPLRTYDEQRGTSLTQTLRVFLEENRSWVRASERLYVHRQTLIARISRIEKIIDRDLSSIEDTAECWLAVQAAIECGDLDPGEYVPSPDPDPEEV